MPFFYQSGEQIKPGDRVRLHGEAGEVEFVADPPDGPDRWHVKRYDDGVMVTEPKVFGSLFLPAPAIGNYEDLAFVSRGE